MSNKRLHKLMLTLFALLAIIGVFFSSFVNVEARIADGEGGDPTESGSATWYNAETTGQRTAWEEFTRIHVRPGVNGRYRWPSRSRMEGGVNTLGPGFEHSPGNNEDLSVSCAKSNHVWWYGHHGRETADYYKKRIYFLARNTNNPNLPRQYESKYARRSWQRYLNWEGSRWNNGQVVLVCSGSYEPREPLRITVAANSGDFTYNNRNHTVKGLNEKKSDTSKLKSGHKLNFSATRTEKNVGSYPVRVTRARVEDRNGKNVSDQYAITRIDGVMNINPDLNTPLSGDDERCVSRTTDTARANVLNITRGTHGFTPSGAPNLNSLYGELKTEAGELVNSIPVMGDSESAWKTWKSKFEAGTSTETPEIDLEAGGVSGPLSRYGGVYNITSEFKRDTYTATTCQPQKREEKIVEKTRTVEVCTTDADGNKTCRNERQKYEDKEWGKWEDNGERIVESISGPKSNVTYNNYQILSVNYNKPGFDSVKSEIGGRDLSLAQGHGGAVLETPRTSGAVPGKLGRGSHVTRTDSFYNDGNSIRDNIVCTSNSNVHNVGVSYEPIYNTGIEPLYSHIKNPDMPAGGNQEHDLLNENNELVFFRDNENRQVRLDVWYPKPTDLSDVTTRHGSNAVASHARVYEGSPEGAITTISPWRKENQKINLQDKADGGVEGERTWNHQTVNRFLVKSQWSSDKGSPYKFGVNWEYEADGKNIVPSVVDGNKVVTMTDAYNYVFNVICEFKPELGDFQASTPNIPYVNKSANKVWNPINAVKVLFTRSSSDSRN